MKRNEQIRAEANHRYNGSTFFELKFIEGAKWADANPQWISVEDELPPNKGGFSDEVLIYDHASKRYVVAMFSYISNCWFGCDDTITPWLPLPQPPKKGDKRLPYKKQEINGNQGKISPNRIIGTPEHIQVALDVLDKKGGGQ